MDAGIVATKLMHKVALSASLGYLRAWNNPGHHQLPVDMGPDALAYSFSVNMLVFPRVYTSYRQANLNVFLEFLGQYSPALGHQYLDVAPAIQGIFNSRTRVDLFYRVELAGGMRRLGTRSWLFRIEYNIFNAY